MNAQPCQLDLASRQTVLVAIQDLCRHESWILLAAHVRLTHVHMTRGSRSQWPG